MEDLDFITTLAYFLNVGVFSAVISRFPVRLYPSLYAVLFSTLVLHLWRQSA